MKRFTLFVLILCVLSAGAPLIAQNASLTAEIDRLIQQTFKPDSPGAAVLVAEKGQIIYQKAAGSANIELGVPLRTDHVFRIGSITKQFTAAAIMQLVEKGKLSLQDSLRKFIPDYPLLGDRQITIEHLLTHTSGIKSYTDMKDWDATTRRKDFSPIELIDYFKFQPIDFRPGDKYKYNNSGYILLGYIIEQVSGEAYGTYVANHFFKPLGMNHSYYGDVLPLIKNRVNGYSKNEVDGAIVNSEFLSMTQPYAAGSLLSTVEDLLIWTKALHSGKVVSAESFKKMTTPHVLPNGTNTHYGYGLATGNFFGSPTVEHSGGINGFLSNLVYLPKEDVCLAILANCDCEPPSDLADDILALATGKNRYPVAVKLEKKIMEEYVGVYENDQNEQRVITLEDGQLYSMRTGGGKFKIMPSALDQFFFEKSPARIQFVREEKSGQKVIKALVSDRTSADNVWVKTAKPLPEARKEIKLTEAQMDQMTGVYELAPGFSLNISREGAQMYCQATGQPRLEVFASSATRLFLKVVDAEIEFFPEGKSPINKMVLHQNGLDLEGKRTK